MFVTIYTFMLYYMCVHINAYTYMYVSQMCMYRHVCMFVYMHVHIYTHIHIRITPSRSESHVRMSACMHVCMHACVQARMYVLYLYIYIHRYILCIHQYIIYIHIICIVYIHICMYIYIYISHASCAEQQARNDKINVYIPLQKYELAPTWSPLKRPKAVGQLQLV
jgi:hypothetical protein